MFWRRPSGAKNAPQNAPPSGGLSLERFLADPTPLAPSPRGAMHFTTGNVEMWPPPNCEAALPPVGGGGGMPGMPGMPTGGAAPVPVSSHMVAQATVFSTAGAGVSSMPTPPAMSQVTVTATSVVEHHAYGGGGGTSGMYGYGGASGPCAAGPAGGCAVAGAAMPPPPSSVPSSSPTSMPPTSLAASPASGESSTGQTGTQVVAWMDVGRKPMTTGRRQSGMPGLPDLPPHSGSPGARGHEVPTAATGGATAATGGAVAVSVETSQLPASWAAAITTEPHEERGEPSGEVAEAGEEEGDGEEADEEASRDDLLAKLKVAKQALLWERAVTQRLRSQLDMAEAWAGPSDGQEVLALKAQVASLTKQNEQLQRDAESSSSTSEHPEASEAEQEQLQKAQEEAADLKSKLKAAEARLVQEQDQREAAAKEVERLREQVSSSEANRVEEAQAIRACVDELRANAQKATVLQAKLTAAEDQAKSLQEQLEQREAAAQKEVERWRVQVAEAHRAEEAKAIRACVEELRAQLQAKTEESRAQASQAAEKAAEELRREVEELRSARAAEQAQSAEAEAKQEDLQAQLQKMEAVASEHESAQDDLRAQLRKMEASASDHDTEQEDLREQLRKMEANASNHETEKEELRVQLRKTEQHRSEHETAQEDLRAQLRKVEANSSEAIEAAQEDLRAQLRKMEASVSDHESVQEDLRSQLRKMEAAASEENEKMQAGVKAAEALRQQIQHANEDQEAERVRLRHVEKRNAELESQVQEFQSVQLRKTKPKEIDVAVQTEEDTAQSIKNTKRKTRKSVFFHTEKQSLPGSLEGEGTEEGEEVARRARNFKSVDFGQHDEDVYEVHASSGSDGDDRTERSMSAMTSMLSQASEFYDTYNETSQPTRARARSTIETYSEEDLWDPEHVAMVTRKLFPKHDKDKTGRIDWASGEATKFLEEFFWLHKQPPPKIPKAPFQSLYDQVKSEKAGYDAEEDKGLNVEQMTAFAIKVHQFVYKQLGKEMRAQRKSFAVTEDELRTLHRSSIEMELGQDAQAEVARMKRRTTIKGTLDLSGLVEHE
ncbi:unnamed protein product [Durusdinium trenchii]|uniref:EF-hand domain-containing protein n=2 Tax=Durusdinium trenchii TaxID=1381693 RepID=A0ABP0LJD3_9DINO